MLRIAIFHFSGAYPIRFPPLTSSLLDAHEAVTSFAKVGKMYYYRAKLRVARYLPWHVVRPSVRLSVCDVEVS